MYSGILFQQPESQILRVMSPLISVSLAIIGLGEVYGIRLFEYSKFSPLKGKSRFVVSGKNGMLICYFPSFLVGVASLLLTSFIHREYGTRFLLLNLALTIHFLKRVMEVLFVHKYSGIMPVGTVTLISLTYIFVTLSMLYIQHLSLGYPEPLVDLKAQGFLLFLLGITGNFYHHFLLSRLRKSGEKQYKIPKGGLFDFVICPHYLFEIMEFFGVSLISQTLFPLCFNLGSAFYLIGRSCATRQWYISKFEKFPKDVKAIIPFIL